MIPAKISLVTVAAYHVPKLREFYLSLGWAETEISSDNYAVFRTSGVLLSIFPIEEALREAGLEPTQQDRTPPIFKGVTLSINVENPEQVDYILQEVEKHGGRTINKPKDASWGGRIGHFMDPENNLWEVAWNPTATFNEYGAMISF
ncbi:VOC family protein [Saccharibacillus sp. JS10]|uniref:VOC family protein n=1 Tax=Saccharibacillus sp. JS10 TaxID=2950552 RepID=UPI0021089387|nr:VOC family protein [Saccharibacillus sp. JS10]MCQ4085351.1 VOC family protein [Saccharibacillus sp. JS10]